MNIVTHSSFHQYRMEHNKVTEYVRLNLFNTTIPRTKHHIRHFSFDIFDNAIRYNKANADIVEWLEGMGVHRIEYTSYEDILTYSTVYIFSVVVPVQLQVMYNLKFS